MRKILTAMMFACLLPAAWAAPRKPCDEYVPSYKRPPLGLFVPVTVFHTPGYHGGPATTGIGVGLGRTILGDKSISGQLTWSATDATAGGSVTGLLPHDRDDGPITLAYPGAKRSHAVGFSVTMTFGL